MFPVFGRDRDDAHSCVAELRKWADPGSLMEQRAIARNLMHDDRVSEEQEKAFLQFVAQHPSDLDKALKNYFNRRVRTRYLPSFVYLRYNRQNLITGPQCPQPGLDGGVMLARVLELNGLWKPVDWAIFEMMTNPRRKFRPECRKIWGRRGTVFGSEPRFSDWLDKVLLNASDVIKEELVIALLDVLHQHRKQSPYQPVWATGWDLFELHVRNGGVNHWAEALGTHKIAGRWLMVLAYSVDDAGTVARPTFLESDRYKYHFPSPASEPPGKGGHPMNLQMNPVNLLPEFIHKEISHTTEHWIKTGRLLDRTTAAASVSLDQQRRNHHELLCQRYGENKIKTWMLEAC